MNHEEMLKDIKETSKKLAQQKIETIKNNKRYRRQQNIQDLGDVSIAFIIVSFLVIMCICACCLGIKLFYLIF